MKTKKKAKSIKTLKQARVEEAALTAKQIQAKREFLQTQKNYRNSHAQRLFNGAKYKLLKEELDKKQKDKNYESRLKWEGLPYTLPMIAVFLDQVYIEYNDVLESEVYYEKKLKEDYGLSEEQIETVKNALNKDLFKEPPKLPENPEEEKIDYAG